MNRRIDGRRSGMAAAAVALAMGMLIAVPAGAGAEGFSLGCNLWNIYWGAATDGGPPYYNYFKKGVTWNKTKDPWNPTFLAELKEAKIKCIRFMDWGCTNGSEITSWYQRIPKAAIHYNTSNIWEGTGFGVAYDWMIDLCNKANADMWVCVPHKADSLYSFELAKQIRDQLDPGLKVYVEYSNEVWNSSMPQYSWVKDCAVPDSMPIQGTWQGRRVELAYGMGHNPAKYVYRTCMVMNQFNKVFGENSPRVVKVLAGFYALSDDDRKDNYLCNWHMYCVSDKRCNPWNVKIDAYAVAPYYGGCDESHMRGALKEDIYKVKCVKNSLKGTGIPVIGYEGGADNWGCQDVAQMPFQEQLTYDAMNIYCDSIFDQGIFNWYCFNGGGYWGFKVSVGDSIAKAPRWRGLMKWRAEHPVGVVRHAPAPTQSPRCAPIGNVYNLYGRRMPAAARRGAVAGIYIAGRSGNFSAIARIAAAR